MPESQTEQQRLRELVPAPRAPTMDKRYTGSGFSVSIGDFGDHDQSLIRAIYDQLMGLYHQWLQAPRVPVEDRPELVERIDSFCSGTFRKLVNGLGRDSGKGGGSAQVRQALHDIRGGALNSLVCYAQLTALGLRPESMRPIAFVYYARDHAKIMRNAIHDLDTQTRADDEEEKAHDVDGLLAPWEAAPLPGASRAIEVHTQDFYRGGISSCCLELSALERVLYNYLNNAARFAADDRIVISSLLIDTVVRIVVENRISDEQVAWTQEATGGDLSALFRGGITSGGNGIGLGNCAKIAGASFGLRDRDEVLARHIVGARISGNTYAAWVHWPAY